MDKCKCEYKIIEGFGIPIRFYTKRDGTTSKFCPYCEKWHPALNPTKYQ